MADTLPTNDEHSSNLNLTEEHPSALTTPEGIKVYLQEHYSHFFSHITTVERLPEGFSGFVFRVHHSGAETPTVIVKHAEGYAARAPSWPLHPSRMSYERMALDYLSQPEFSDDRIRVPKVRYHDNDQHVLVMEDVGDLPSVKAWFRHGNDLAKTQHIGRALGDFLANLHNKSAGNQELLNRFGGNETAKKLSGQLYFHQLPARAKEFGYTYDFLWQAAESAECEIYGSRDVLTVGDFWTGNVLVSDKASEELKLFVLDFELSKPGTAEFDIGQMAAEMLCLAMMRHSALGFSLLSTFLKAYRERRQGTVDAAKVAIRIGAHLIVMMPKAWRNEASAGQIQNGVQTGVGLMRMGWERDETRLRGSIVGSLM